MLIFRISSAFRNLDGEMSGMDSRFDVSSVLFF